jgi:hypothetical protein
MTRLAVGGRGGAGRCVVSRGGDETPGGVDTRAGRVGSAANRRQPKAIVAGGTIRRCGGAGQAELAVGAKYSGRAVTTWAPVPVLCRPGRRGGGGEMRMGMGLEVRGRTDVVGSRSEA